MASWMHPMLYSPLASHKKGDVRLVDGLIGLANGDNPFVLRLAIDAEDALPKDLIEAGMDNLQAVLVGINPESPVDVFIRVRDPQMLESMLEFAEIKRVRGFILPKLGPMRYRDFMRAIKEAGCFRALPILESEHLYRRDWRDELLSTMLNPENHGFLDLIDCLRLGGNDLMGIQNMRRSRECTIYEMVGIRGLLDDLVNDFRGHEKIRLPMSAPVYELVYEKYDDLLRRELRQEVTAGLLGKTTIHLRHLEIIWEIYQVDPEDLEDARSILGTKHAVELTASGRMNEPTTHRGWAEFTLARAEVFGVRDVDPLPSGRLVPA